MAPAGAVHRLRKYRQRAKQLAAEAINLEVPAQVSRIFFALSPYPNAQKTEKPNKRKMLLDNTYRVGQIVI